MIKPSKIVGFLATAAIVAVSIFAISNRYDIADWYRLRNYQPSEEIAALRERTSMTDLGEKLFYVHDPQLLDKTGFNDSCDFGEKTIVLGCYDGRHIYLYDVRDADLAGIKEVTAAHEMLHAAYERLSDSEKQRLSALLEAALKNSGSRRLHNLLESYRERDPSSVQNELHSIIGTELRNISEELEEYYARYFTDRLRVVQFSENYESVFVDLQNDVERLDAELLLRKAQIERAEMELIYSAEQLRQDRQELDNMKSDGRTAEHNARVGSYNAEVAAYNQKLRTTRELIADYNRLVAERNALSHQQNDLLRNLNSRAEDL